MEDTQYITKMFTARFRLMDDLINLSKSSILIVWWWWPFPGDWTSRARLARPDQPNWRPRLAQLHQERLGRFGAGDRLEAASRLATSRCSAMYDQSIHRPNSVLGEIETISCLFFLVRSQRASAQSWLQKPRGLPDLDGLLGTFAGLTVGLVRSPGALGKNAKHRRTMTALGNLAPWEPRFRRALVGSLSEFARVNFWEPQIVGTRNALEPL